MPHYDYLIIGGGMTADAAATGIRELDSSGSIGVIAAELHPPYKRPPLSKALWKDKPEDSIWLGTAERGVDLLLGRRVTQLDPAGKRVVDDQQTQCTYNKLLLATGGVPRRLQFDPPGVIYYRTLDDYHSLRGLADAGRRFVVIGGGFIGSEVAAALAMNGREVVMIFPEHGVCGAPLPSDLSEFLNGYYRERGVEVVTQDVVADVLKRDDGWLVKTLGGREIGAAGVVAGLGINPNTTLADAAGLALENGIRVDESCRTSDPSIYAAGDAASFHNPALGRRIRVEHEDNAVTMGETAGRAMAGATEPYHHLPYFYSDLFDLGYEAVGDLDSRLEAYADWKEPFTEGVVYYLSEGRVRGVLLWNVWDKVPEARSLIAEPGPFRPEDLKGRI